MAYSFRRGVRAMSVTSSTTAVAFFANIFSPLMPIKSFGLFSGVLIPINFLLVIFIMPPAIIWWEKNFLDKPCCYCCRQKNDYSAEQLESQAASPFSNLNKSKKI